jgi:hypothetical protein
MQNNKCYRDIKSGNKKEIDRMGGNLPNQDHVRGITHNE